MIFKIQKAISNSSQEVCFQPWDRLAAGAGKQAEKEWRILLCLSKDEIILD